MSHDEHVCKPSCHNPCLLDKDNPYKRAAADAGPRQLGTCAFTSKNEHGRHPHYQTPHCEDWEAIAPPVPQEAAPTEPYRIDHTTVLDFDAEIEYIKEIDRKATAPDWAMRVARELGNMTPWPTDEQAAALIREAGADTQHWQTRYQTDHNVIQSLQDGLADLRERLRQREAELEQLRAVRK